MEPLLLGIHIFLDYIEGSKVECPRRKSLINSEEFFFGSIINIMGS